MNRLKVGDYHFKYDGKGIYADGRFNFADPGCIEAMTEAVRQWRVLIQKDPHSYVYLGWSESRQAYKIGKSDNPDVRAGEQGLKIVHTILCPSSKEAFQLEAFFHILYNNRNLNGHEEFFLLYEHQVDWMMSFVLSAEVPRELPEGAKSHRSRKHRSHNLGWKPHE